MKTKPKPSVLVVDDDAAFRRVMSTELGRLGYETASAASGEEAVSRVAETGAEVVLLDMRLPGMNGLEVLKALRDGGSDTGACARHESRLALSHACFPSGLNHPDKALQPRG